MNICGICGKPVKRVKRFNNPPMWEHIPRKNTPVPWHDPSPKKEATK